MKIDLVNAGKRYNHDWIFRHLNYQFASPGFYAITGANGSGKSTLLQIIATSTTISEGSVDFTIKDLSVDPSIVYQQISMVAPYLDLIEEMTLSEFLNFHNDLKPFIKSVRIKDIIHEISLEQSANKQIRYFSSGMKQRVKLAQCVFSDTPILLLDEPCTNLDVAGIELYNSMLEKYCRDRLVIISSNDPIEYKLCNERIEMKLERNKSSNN